MGNPMSFDFKYGSGHLIQPSGTDMEIKDLDLLQDAIHAMLLQEKVDIYLLFLMIEDKR
jgi:hypothetical protein